MGTSKILIDGVGIDLTQDTVAANKMLSGVKAHDSNGDCVTGSIPSKAAQTYTPGTTDQSIAAGQYLSGAQTVKGDANLIAGNIKQGVSIFGVNGNLTPGITPSGTKQITANGTYDVAQYASAVVAVPQGSLSSKVFNVNIPVDSSGNVTLIDSDSDIAAHYADANAVAVLVPRFEVSKATALSSCVTTGRKTAKTRGTVGLYIATSGGAATYTNDGTLTSAQGVQLAAGPSGRISFYCGTSRLLEAGEYVVIFAW